jgi:uncharacterized membrane protein
MDSKINTVGILWMVLGILTILGAVFMAVSGGAFMAGMHAPDERAGGAIFASIMWIIAAFVLVIGIFEFLAGSALRKHRPWARIAIIVLSIINLFGFPIGTIVGIYSLVVLLSADAKPVFT